jgi:23S rRNA (guanosine2251-2'-O)-methyltransferase
MAGNSKRKGATRNPGSRKGATAGSGGKVRRGLKGKGPTPKAEDRDYHPAAKKKKTAEKRAATKRPEPRRSGTSRRGSAVDIIAGRNSVVEALRAKTPAKVLLVALGIDIDERVREAVALAHGQGLEVQDLERGDLDRITDGAVHQGIALRIPPYEYLDAVELLERAVDAGLPLLVALDGVTDPRNLGAIVRSAAAFGAHGVIVPERRSAEMTAAAWKTAAGAAARVPVAKATNLVRALKECQKSGCMVVGLDADGDVDLGQFELGSGPVVLVIGSEGKGLSRLVRETCDQVVSISMAGSSESLNAAVAAGIALHAVAESRK